MLDWDDVRYFLAIAREGSLSSAARALRVTQPTVGRRLTAFEAKLGSELFERTPSGQKPTATGRRLLPLAERMEADALSVERLGSGRDAGLRGPIRITASEWLIQRLLGPMLAPLGAEHPELELELWADTRHLSLVRRECDLALRPSKFEQSEIVQRVVGSVSFGLYAADAYLLRHGVPDFATGAVGHRVIAMSEALTKVPDVEFLPRVAWRARVIARTNGREAMAAMAVAGLGMSCLPRLVGDATPGLRYLPAPVQDPRRQLFLGFHGDLRAVPRMRACTAVLTAAFERLASALTPVSP